MFKKFEQYHSYHIVTPSPWPLLTSICAFALVSSGALYMHRWEDSGWFLFVSVVNLVIMMVSWWRDVIREGTYEGMHTVRVQSGLKLGMALFILSEVMFFFGFFWAYFHFCMDPSAFLGGIWPPYGIEAFNPYSVPLLNTFVLLLSGATVTVAHYHLLLKDSFKVGLWLIYTLVCAVFFLSMQGYEYFTAPFDISDGVFGSIFFMATGFHGFHVLVGTIFLAVCYARVERYHFRKEHHIGFLAAAWYWHFVDVVWLFLYVMVYWLPSVL
jgi:heme/copper-type cytochrome/quinol oxidase subunit 3